MATKKSSNRNTTKPYRFQLLIPHIPLLDHLRARLNEMGKHHCVAWIVDAASSRLFMEQAICKITDSAVAENCSTPIPEISTDVDVHWIRMPRRPTGLPLIARLSSMCSADRNLWMLYAMRQKSECEKRSEYEHALSLNVSMVHPVPQPTHAAQIPTTSTTVPSPTSPYPDVPSQATSQIPDVETIVEEEECVEVDCILPEHVNMMGVTFPCHKLNDDSA